MMRNDMQIGTVSIVGEKTEEIPMWTINHYFKVFCDNYAKYVMLTKLRDAAGEGAYCGEFFVSGESAPLVPNANELKKYLYDDKRQIKISLKEDPERFWHLVNKCERPMVYRNNHEGMPEPLYDCLGEEAVKITDVSYHCPIKIDIQGIVSGLTDLAMTKSRYEMECEEHAAHQIENLARGYERIAKAEQVISDSRTPEGIKAYAEDGLRKLLVKQEKLNNALGIRVDKIDKRV